MSVARFTRVFGQICLAPAPFPEALRKTRTGRQIEGLVLKAMAKAPQDRHPYILELSSELKAIELGATGFRKEFGALLHSVDIRALRRSKE